MTENQQKRMFSSKDQKWETPEWLFHALDQEFGFTLDPCCVPETAKCEKFFTPEDDGLFQSWEDETVFMNPPYKNCEEWMRKALMESKRGAIVVCLVPVRSDTQWWHTYAMRGEIRLFRQRIKFKKGGKRSDVAPFPTCVVVFRPEWFKIIDVGFNQPSLPLWQGKQSGGQLC